MRILLTTVAVKSHIYTQVPLAWALRGRIPGVVATAAILTR